MSHIFTNPHEAALTPELKQWLVLQASSGVSPQQTLQAMLDAGWNEDTAQYALKTVIGRFLKDPASITSQAANNLAWAKESSPAQAAQAMPDIDLSEKPSTITIDGHQIQVISHLKHPRIVVLANFLTDAECHALIAAAKPRMRRSLTVDTQSTSGGDALNADRTSDGMFFNQSEGELVARIEARIATLLRWPIHKGEGLQVLHYLPGAQYKAHYDYFDPHAASAPALLARGGQRLGTLLMYLNTPVKGGGTTFPAVGFEVAAQKGYAVFFSYDKPDPSTLSLHGGAPVIEGEKWVATKWLRENAFV